MRALHTKKQNLFVYSRPFRVDDDDDDDGYDTFVPLMIIAV